MSPLTPAARELPRPPLACLERQGSWLALLALAAALHVFEALLPSLGPWFKPGLANGITLIALAHLGARTAAAIALGRVLLGALLLGTLFTPTFIISLTAAVAATAAMLAAWRWLPGVSLIGASLVGALVHMTTQFVTVEQLFIRQEALYLALPPLLLLATVTGWLNGAVARHVAARLGAPS